MSRGRVITCQRCGIVLDSEELGDHLEADPGDGGCLPYCDDCDDTGWLPNDRPETVEDDPPYQRCPWCWESRGFLGEDERGLGAG